MMIRNYLCNLKRDSFTLGDDALHGARTDDVPERGLRPLDESRA
jgi:hypothetical protein